MNTNTCLLFSILFIYNIRKNRWRPGLCPESRSGSAQCSPMPRRLEPPTACECGAHSLAPCDSCLRRSSRTAVSKLWSP